MPVAKDLTDRRFGRLRAVARTGEKRWGVYIWRCVCDCGIETTAAVNSLTAGLVQSCGCLASQVATDKALRHGLAGSPTYNSWDSMVQRCTNPNATGFARYGGAGVAVCAEWLAFAAFLADMGTRPEGTTLDRRDNSLGYAPDNCRWATGRQQRMNQVRSTLSLEDAARVRALRAETGWGPKRIAEALGVSRAAVSGVLYLGNLSPL